MYFKSLVEMVGLAVDGAGVGVIVIGILFATVRMLPGLVRGRETYRPYRQDVGRAILLGLELLVAGDIIRTVAVAPTLAGVTVLGVIVLIRTFLSMSLEVELEGRWPWRAGGGR
jgi:uncharacterized membrane protein